LKNFYFETICGCFYSKEGEERLNDYDPINRNLIIMPSININSNRIEFEVDSNCIKVVNENFFVPLMFQLSQMSFFPMLSWVVLFIVGLFK
jgi:hypothetical protein